MMGNRRETGGRFFGGSRGGRPWSLPLVLRIGLCLAAITGLALFTMVASMMIADTAKDDAAAINKAGALRMQSYRMLDLSREPAGRPGLDAAIERFEGALVDDAIATALPGEAHPLTGRYQRVREHWAAEMRPMLEKGDPDVTTAVDTFVAELDTIVAGMQQQAETRIQMLRLIQGIAIFLTVGLVFGTMYLLHTGVVTPLRELRRAAARARGGDLEARVSHTGDDELGTVGRTFNTMAASIQDMHRGLEREVDAKTRDLQRSNDALSLLYQTARALTAEGTRPEAMQQVVNRLREVIGSDGVTLCLSEAGGKHAYQSCTSERDEPPDFCERTIRCERCMEQLRRGTATEPGVASFPLLDTGVRHGVLLVEHPPGELPAAWKLRLAEAVADQVATALARASQTREQRRLALLEERAVIARELHDSLAQSLSYLKIQVSRLQTLHGRGEHGTSLEQVMGELRQGLNEAYRHLRELLDSFRLTMNEPGLEPALEATTEEFSRRGGLPIRLRIQLTGEPLDSNTEVHLLHVAREALSNVVNHAGATEAAVTLTGSDNGALSLTVEDNGSGIPGTFERLHHYGTQIMRERAKSLGGRCTITRRAEGGTRVHVERTAPPPGTVIERREASG